MDVNHTKFKYNLRERLSSSKKQPHLGKIASRELLHWSRFSSSRNHSDSGSVDYDYATPSSVFNNKIQVPIGPLFQADVPEWTGVAFESDAKWLGTRIWPSEEKENRFFIERDRIGKGRQDSCGCHIRDSVQCVRFHIAEKRLKVKLELGLAFYRWKFDKMGEEVASSWKDEEKKMFSSTVEANPRSFWEKIHENFHKRSREELVCYYFNVFLTQHRAYQNRICPKNISYDDEEIGDEAELVGIGLRHKATTSCTTILIPSKKSQKKSRYSS